jgi:eukaryotic-like serine/threonine-protein kinase
MPRRPIRVGKYEIVAKIGKGGMGSVFKAKHPTLNRFVILKQLTLKGGSGFIERFKREASLMLDFRDEHIVQVYDHFKEGSSYYIAMEYVDGTSLDRLLSERRSLSNEASLLLLSEIAKALKHAHDKCVIHRDIKPANILISKDGEVKLTDFGIATTKEADDEGLTKAGMTLGTPAYMSPEQISDTRKVDKRADIYSLGVVFYEMITGTKPFPSSFTPQAINYINRGIYVKPQKINPSIPGIYKRIIKKTMNRKVKRRYKDLGHLLEILDRYTRKYKDQRQINRDIRKYLSGEEISFPTRFLFGLKERRRRGYGLRLAVAVVAVALLALGGAFFYYGGYWHERFKSREFGSLEIGVAVPDNYFKEPDDVYAKAVLTPDGKKTPVVFRLHPRERNVLVRLRSFPRGFSTRAELPSSRGSGSLLTTGTRYLPAGEYTLDLYMENAKMRKVFTLRPRVIQKLDVKTAKRETIQVSLEDPEPKSLSIIHRVRDADTGADILSETAVSLYLPRENVWIDLKRAREQPKLRELLERELRSGRRFTFKYEAPLRYPATLRVFAERNLDTLALDVALLKEPGRLLVSSDTAGLSILIDNRKEGYLGIRRKSFASYGETVKGTREFSLPEGKYVLTVKKDDRHQQNQQFALSAGRKTELEISYPADGKKIAIRTKSTQE